jgi:hypothetical protein
MVSLRAIGTASAATWFASRSKAIRLDPERVYAPTDVTVAKRQPQ